MNDLKFLSYPCGEGRCSQCEGLVLSEDEDLDEKVKKAYPIVCGCFCHDEEEVA